MSRKKPTYAELQARLEQAEATLAALRRGEIDSLMGEAGPLLVQYKSVVDELTRLRAEAEQLAQQWQATFDAASDAVWILDAEQRVVRSNRAAEEAFHCPVAEMYGRRCCEIAHQTAEPIPECPFRPMRQSLQRESLEMQIGERWYTITVDPLLDADRRLTGAVHIARDITRRKEAEEKLRESEEQYRLLAETTRDIILLHDMQGLITYVNQAGLEFGGYSEAEVLGKPITAFVPAERIAEIEERHRQRAAGNQAVFCYETELINRAGQRVPVEVNSTPILREGRLEYILIVARDITARRQAETQIHFQANLVANVSDAIIATDLEHNILSWNAAAEAIYGWTAAEVLGQPVNRFLRTQFVDDTLKASIRTVTEKGVWKGEVVQSRKDGTTVSILASVTLFRDREGNPQGLVAVNRDITARKEAEAQLQAAHAELQHLLAEAEQSRRALLSLVEDQKVAEQALRESNRRLSALNRLGLALAQTLDLPTIYRIAYEHVAPLVDCPCFGISRYDPATQTLQAEYMLSDGELLDATRFPPLPFRPDMPLKGRVRAVQAQQPEIVTDMPTPSSGQVTIVGKSDEEHIARSALYVPIVVRGQTSGLLEVQSYRENAYGEADVALLGPVANQIGLAIENAQLFAALEAERNSLAQRVRERTAELQAANQELEAFAYSVSHDLRAPLRALDGFSAALLSRYQEQLDEQGQHFLNRIQEASRRMGQLIEDLLNLSRVTRREMDRQPVDLGALAREIAAELQAREPQRQVEFVIAPQMVVQGDAHLLRIALENLVGNAWKFTGKREQARIEVSCLPHPTSPLQAGEGREGVTYFVRDNGVGFDMTYAAKLFAPFQRLHGTEEFPGTGIGLATVQRIITRHGGRIWAEAAVDQGATFYFTLGGVP